MNRHYSMIYESNIAIERFVIAKKHRLIITQNEHAIRAFQKLFTKFNIRPDNCYQYVF